MRSGCRGTRDEGRVIIATAYDGVKTRSLCHHPRYCARLVTPPADETRRLHDTPIRRLRPYRTGAGAAPGPHLPRAATADRAARLGRLLRVSPGRTPHAGYP